MSTSRLLSILDKLIDTFTVALAAASPTGGPITVYDGPAPSSAAELELVIVGDNDDNDDNDDSANTEQTWAGLGAKARDEQGEITCTIVCQDGSQQLKPLRTRGFAILALIENALRADPSLAGVITSGWAHITETSLRQAINEDGAIARVVFTVEFKTRI